MNDLLLRRRMMMVPVLPAEYEMLNYIEATGDQYLVTNVNQGLNVKTTLIFEPTSTSFSTFGAIAAARSSYQVLVTMTSFNRFYSSMYDSNNNVIPFTKSNHPFEAVFNDENHNLFIDGNLVGVLQPISPYPEDTKIALFSFFSGSSRGIGRVYKFVISENDTHKILFSGIPVRRIADQEIGMWDTVSKTFLTNAGTGAFTGA